MSEAELDFGLRRNGKLVLCPDEKVLVHQAALQSERSGVEKPARRREACVAIDPALGRFDGFVGGVWTPRECLGELRVAAHADARIAQQPFRQCRHPSVQVHGRTAMGAHDPQVAGLMLAHEPAEQAQALALFIRGCARRASAAMAPGCVQPSCASCGKLGAVRFDHAQCR